MLEVVIFVSKSFSSTSSQRKSLYKQSVGLNTFWKVLLKFARLSISRPCCYFKRYRLIRNASGSTAHSVLKYCMIFLILLMNIHDEIDRIYNSYVRSPLHTCFYQWLILSVTENKNTPLKWGDDSENLFSSLPLHSLSTPPKHRRQDPISCKLFDISVCLQALIFTYPAQL